MFDVFLDILVPKYCIYCLKPGEYLCSNCYKRLDRVLPICPVCNRLSQDYRAHKTCETKGINQIFSLYNYNKISSKLIKEVKYRNRTKVLDFFIEISKEKIGYLLSSKSSNNSLLIPIPLHKKRYLERGFNQSELISNKLSNITTIPSNTDLIKRMRNNKKQSEISYKNKKLRVKNTNDIFEINKKESKTIQKDTQLIIVDDVVTTKSTVLSLAHELQKAGFKNISAFSLFRAHPYHFSTIEVKSLT